MNLRGTAHAPDKRLCRMAGMLFALMLLGFSSACAQTNSPELNLRIGMPVAEVINQDAAKALRIELEQT